MPPYVVLITPEPTAPDAVRHVAALEGVGVLVHVCATLSDASSRHPTLPPDVLIFAACAPPDGPGPWQPPPLKIALTPAHSAPPAYADLVLPIDAPALLIANLPVALARHRLWASQQQQQHALDTLKNAIVRNVSHEMRTPLLQVKSAVAMLAEDLPGNRLVDYAIQATTRLEHVVLNLSHLADSFDVAPAPFTPGDAVQAALRAIRRTWVNRQAADRVRVCLDDGLPPVFADQRSIAVVLQLLLDNALKFSQAPVTLSAVGADDGVHFTVEDQGVGIPSELHQRIFDPFVQADPSSTRAHNGLGMGLAVVRLILQRHNTSIALHSELGRGSRFTFILPLSPAHADAHQQQPV